MYEHTFFLGCTPRANLVKGVLYSGARKHCFTQYTAKEINPFLAEFWSLRKTDQDSLVTLVAFQIVLEKMKIGNLWQHALVGLVCCQPLETNPFKNVIQSDPVSWTPLWMERVPWRAWCSWGRQLGSNAWLQFSGLASHDWREVWTALLIYAMVNPRMSPTKTPWASTPFWPCNMRMWPRPCQTGLLCDLEICWTSPCWNKLFFSKHCSMGKPWETSKPFRFVRRGRAARRDDPDFDIVSDVDDAELVTWLEKPGLGTALQLIQQPGDDKKMTKYLPQAPFQICSTTMRRPANWLEQSVCRSLVWIWIIYWLFGTRLSGLGMN